MYVQYVEVYGSAVIVVDAEEMDSSFCLWRAKGQIYSRTYLFCLFTPSMKQYNVDRPLLVKQSFKICRLYKPAPNAFATSENLR